MSIAVREHELLSPLREERRRVVIRPALQRGAVPLRCPVCHSPADGGRDETTSYACGAVVGPHALGLCDRAPEEVLLQALWGWCRRQELFRAASCVRKRVVPRLERPRPLYGLALLPPGGAQAPERCPLCDAGTEIDGPFLRRFACGCSLHRKGSWWQGYEPCPEASLEELLLAMSSADSSAWFQQTLSSVRDGASYDLWM